MNKHTHSTARWTPALRKLKAICIRQPWAWLIVSGYKDIENRKWATNVRGPILIHAGLTRPSSDELEHFLDVWPEAMLDYGGVIGVVNIADCVTKHRSKWFRGRGFGWVLAKPRYLSFKKCPGKLKFFDPAF